MISKKPRLNAGRVWRNPVLVFPNPSDLAGVAVVSEKAKNFKDLPVDKTII